MRGIERNAGVESSGPPSVSRVRSAWHLVDRADRGRGIMWTAFARPAASRGAVVERAVGRPRALVIECAACGIGRTAAADGPRAAAAAA